MIEEELGPVITSQLDKVAMQYCSEESKNHDVVNKILEGLKIPANCSSVSVCLYQMELQLKIETLHQLKKGWSEIIRYFNRISFTISAVFEIADEQILAQNENKPPNLKKVIDRTVDSVTLIGRTQKQTLAKRKEHL